MTDKFLTLGSTLAAFLASLCCLGPLLLGGLGLGAALSATFTPLRPYFLGASAVLLGLGFYFVYRQPKAPEVCEGEVCAPDNRTGRLAKPLLWLATLTVAALALFPVYGGKLLSATSAAAPAATPAVETVELEISGMTCEACAGVVQSYLLEAPGVAEAEVDYAAGRARVKYDPQQTNPVLLVEAVDRSGYQASLPASEEE
ncbi:MAG: mercuric transporter MerT family protein [Candidatus Acidoferrales bacterium]